MSNCLNEVRVRAAADDEATRSEREHVEACGQCRARVDAARRAAEELTALSERLTPPPSLTENVRRAMIGVDRNSGATTLRDPATFRAGTRLWLTAGAVAAAVILIVFALPPLDAPRAISAAEILDRSLQTLTPAGGVELREFDLDLQLPPVVSVPAGTYRIEQLVDHETPGRFRAVRYAPDGTLLDAISEDPVGGRRTVVVNVDGQLFKFQLTTRPGRLLDLRDLERQHVEAMIRLLQVAAGQTVREVEENGRKRYIVELPAVTDRNASGLWELDRARATIDAGDFQILEMAAAGSYMGDPFSVAFRLRDRRVFSSAEVPADRFAVPAATTVTIDGIATEDIGRDLLGSALRMLAKK